MYFVCLYICLCTEGVNGRRQNKGDEQKNEKNKCSTDMHDASIDIDIDIDIDRLLVFRYVRVLSLSWILILHTYLGEDSSQLRRRYF